MLTGVLRSEYQGPVSFIIKKKKSSSTPISAASRNSEVCEGIRGHGVKALNLRPKRSVSTCDSAFSPGVRIDNTFEGSIPLAAPSTRKIASGSKSSPDHRPSSSYASASSRQPRRQAKAQPLATLHLPSEVPRLRPKTLMTNMRDVLPTARATSVSLCLGQSCQIQKRGRNE